MLNIALIALCVLNACIGLWGTKNCNHPLFFHTATFLLSALLIVWAVTGETIGIWQSILGVCVGYLASFVIVHILSAPWNGTAGDIELLLHFVVVPLMIFYLFPRHIPETDFPLGRPLTLISTTAILGIHFISHPPTATSQQVMYMLWFAAHAAILLFF